MNTYLDLFGLSGRVALVTGATEGVGQYIAYGLAEAGADLVVCGRRHDVLASVASKISDCGRHVERKRVEILALQWKLLGN